jgi:hypothetical protein
VNLAAFLIDRSSKPNRFSDSVPFVHEVQLKRYFHGPIHAEEYIAICTEGIRHSCIWAGQARKQHDKWAHWKLSGTIASMLATRSKPVLGVGLIPIKRALERLFPVKKV